MKKILFILAAVGCMYSCGGTNSSKAQEDKPSVDDFSEIAKTVSDQHNAKNSLDYKGIYSGVVPSEKGGEMKVTITLSDSTFVKTTEHVGKKDKAVEEKNAYAWNEQGSIITLRGVQGPSQYKVGENTLTQLDDAGKIMSEKYVLRK